MGWFRSSILNCYHKIQTSKAHSKRQTETKREGERPYAKFDSCFQGARTYTHTHVNPLSLSHTHTHTQWGHKKGRPRPPCDILRLWLARRCSGGAPQTQSGMCVRGAQCLLWTAAAWILSGERASNILHSHGTDSLCLFRNLTPPSARSAVREEKRKRTFFSRTLASLRTDGEAQVDGQETPLRSRCCEVLPRYVDASDGATWW